MISVVVLTYNRRDSLSRCLKSLINQRYPQAAYEIIVVDDGSTEPAVGLVKKFKEEFKNLVYLYQNHRGVAAARNRGIGASNGHIVFIDDDYLVGSDFVELVNQYLQRYPSLKIFHCRL